ncbi:MAG: hypothetical protein FD181_2203, partial [Prolixibacteraceae bacterium]
MKLNLIVILISVILAGNVKGVSQNKTGDAAQKFAGPVLGPPTGLTVETIRDPRFTKIIDSKPEFSWVVCCGAVF